MKKNNPFEVVAGTLFLVVVAGICLYTAKDLLARPLDYMKSAVVLIGLLGVILYASRLRIYAVFLWTWIVLQFFKVEQIADDRITSIADFHMSVAFSHSFDLVFQGVHYNLGINLLPLIFIPFMFVLPRPKLVGEEFTLKPFRDNDRLNDKMPQVVKVLDILNFSGSKKWVLIHLSKGITYQDIHYFYALVKAKDYISIKKRNVKQIVHFRLFDGHKHPEKGLKEFPFIDWAVLE